MAATTEARTRLVDVAVDLPVPGTYTYALPEPLADAPVGVRVLVEFGNRAVAAVIVGPGAGSGEPVKPIQAVVDDEPLITGSLLELAVWIAGYYRAPPGEVIRAALPPGTRIGAALEVEITPAGSGAVGGAAGALPRGQREVLAVLEAAGCPVARTELLERSRARSVDLAGLAASGWIAVRAVAAAPRVRDRVERVARLVRQPAAEDLDALVRAPVRRAIVDALVNRGGEAPVASLRAVNRQAAAHVRRLVADGLVEVEHRTVRGVADAGAELPAAPPHSLNSDQRAALEAIRAQLDARDYGGFLLHGITGSGKTEVYLNAIAAVVGAGRTAIVLVPEISLTPQLAARFRGRFGDQVAVLHSGLTDRERYDEWHRLRSGDARIALGARSAIFAPVDGLGIVVVDEEHDSSFKQEEGFRYNARDVALMRSKQAGAVCVLGSATPSLESYRLTEVGRLGLLELPERATAGELPAVELVDLRRYQPAGDSMLTAPLAEAVAATLAAGDQTILFLNRRGFNTFVICVACGEAFRCPNCSVSLTYHRASARLLCHYCAHQRRLPERCPSCNTSGSISRRGMGTERVADAVARRFEGARVARLDRDIAAGSRIEKLLGRFSRREIDILVGTQMVTKGHDFPGVTLVGVLCADTGLSLPDFRASERTFQLLTQVAGRAGRGTRAGRVIIQSYRTDHVAIVAARSHDYGSFYRAELGARRELGYPPWGHLVAIRLDGRQPAAVASRAAEVAALIRKTEASRALQILGPAEAPLGRLKGRARWHLWLRAADRASLRAAIRELEPQIATRAGGVRVTLDVDPVSAL